MVIILLIASLIYLASLFMGSIKASLLFISIADLSIFIMLVLGNFSSDISLTFLLCAFFLNIILYFSQLKQDDVFKFSRIDIPVIAVNVILLILVIILMADPSLIIVSKESMENAFVYYGAIFFIVVIPGYFILRRKAENSND